MKPSTIFSRTLFLVALLFNTGYAQFNIREHRVQTYSVEDGLSQSSIWCILQDRTGFMWFGTADGLNRYDGYTFKVFRHNAKDAFSLRSNTVTYLCEDHDGKIWLGTSAGLHRLDPRTNKFLFLPDEPTNSSSHLRTHIYSIVEDRDSNLWVGSLGGLTILNLKSGIIKEYSTSDFGYRDDELGIRVNMIDDKGDVWIYCTQHVFLFQRTTKRFVEVQWPDAVRGRTLTMLLDRPKRMWMGSFENGLYALDESTNTFRNWKANPNNVKSLSGNTIGRGLCQDNEGKLWIGTVSSGLNIFEPDKNAFTRILSELDKTGDTFYDKVSTIYRDRSGIMWIGYDGSGLVKIDPRPNKFRHTLIPPSGKVTSGNNFFKAMMVDRENKVWLGMYNQGVAVLDRNAGNVQRFSYNPSSENSLASNSVFALHEDRTGIVWIGTLSGLNAYNPASKRIRQYALGSLLPGDLRGKIVMSLGEDSAGTVWIGTATSILRFDRQQDKIISVLNVTAIDSLYPFAGPLCFGSANGTLWCGTMGDGLLKLTAEGKLVKRYVSNPAESNSLSHNSVKTICIGPDGILWIGTENGLNRFDPVKESWRAYQTEDGLPNDFIYGVLMDRNSNLWISTNRGLSRMTTTDPEHPQFRNYSVNDGLQSSEFNTNTYFQTPRGEMFFGGVNGFNSFFPDSVNDNPVLPDVVLTRFKKFDQPVEFDEDIAVAKQVQLSYSESVFSLEFAALEFTDSRENRYAYKLEGFDKDWVMSGKRREARYTNLDPGEYTFHVKACNNDGVWNDDAASISILIVPPYWKTGWFFGLMIGLGVVTFGGTVRFISTQKLRKRIEQLEREKAIQDERLRTRERIARDLHDDLASTVGSAGFFIESVKSQLKDVPSKAKEFLDKTSSLLTEAEESMSDIVWSVSPKHDTLESLLSRIRLTTADLCRAHQLKYEIDLDERSGGAALPEDVRRTIYLIFKEALSNAVRHSGASFIKVAFVVRDDCFELRIEDNGKGMPSTELSLTPTKRGHGLRNMAKRAEEVQAEFSLEPNSPSGTIAKLKGRMTQLSH